VNIRFNGIDITRDIETMDAVYTDNAGGKADLLELSFADRDGYQWAQWDAMSDVREISLIAENVTTGKMHIHNVIDAGSGIIIIAASLPKAAKAKRSASWVDVRFPEVAKDICGRNGFSYTPYCKDDFFYPFMSQAECADFAFLSRLCVLEGFYLKAYNGGGVVYDAEAAGVCATIQRYDIDGPAEFFQGQKYGRVTLVSGGGTYTHNGGDGAVYTEHVFFNNIAEAGRWARNLYRAVNRPLYTASLTTRLNTGIAAGAKVSLEGLAKHSGEYFVESARHHIVSQKTELALSRIGSGY